MPAYKCPACDESFHNTEDVLDHEKDHNILKRGCIVPECHRTSGKHLFRHVSLRHPSLCEYHCSFCTRAFVHHVDKSQHEIGKHGGFMRFFINFRSRACMSAFHSCPVLRGPMYSRRRSRFIKNFLCQDVNYSAIDRARNKKLGYSYLKCAQVL